MNPTEAYQLLIGTTLSAIALAASTAIVCAVMAVCEWRQARGYWGM